MNKELHDALDPRIEPWQAPRGPYDDLGRDARYEVLRQPWRVVEAPQCVTNNCQQGRKPCPTPQACEDRAGRQPEAAHAASEYDDDKPGERMVSAIGWVLLAWGVVAVALVVRAVVA